LLIDFEEDRTLRAVLIGMLREATADSPSGMQAPDPQTTRKVAAPGLLRPIGERQTASGPLPHSGAVGSAVFALIVAFLHGLIVLVHALIVVAFVLALIVLVLALIVAIFGLVAF
jgi:hypothetical protein